MNQAAEANDCIGFTLYQSEHAVAIGFVVPLRDLNPVLALSEIQRRPVADPTHSISIALDAQQGECIGCFYGTCNQPFRFKY